MKCSKNAESLLFMKAEMDRDNGADVLSLLRIAIPTSKFQLILCYFFSLFFFSPFLSLILFSIIILLNE